jgi:hypothetical protein
MCSENDIWRGISIDQLFSGTIPEPTIDLVWGKDIPPEIMERLKGGETAILHDKEGKPWKFILYCMVVGLRESDYNPNSINLERNYA